MDHAISKFNKNDKFKFISFRRRRFLDFDKEFNQKRQSYYLLAMIQTKTPLLLQN